MLKRRRVLIADESPAIRLQLSELVRALDHEVRSTASPATVLRWLAQEAADLVILEAGGESAERVREIRQAYPELPILLTSARPNLGTAVEAAGLGALELLAKPIQTAALQRAVTRALMRPQDPDTASAQARAVRDEQQPLIGSGAVMQHIFRTLAGLAEPNLPVLIWGESGVGKARVARALHDLGPRREAPFVRVSVGGFAAEPLAQELAGDVRSAGRIAQAREGSLMLEGVDDLSFEAQSRLLHVLKDQLFRTDVRTRPRLICSARQDLRLALEQGRFREDLFFRLSTATVRLPALRERPEDIPDLARVLLVRAQRSGLPAKQIDAQALARLQRHPWPGNIRELDNLLRRACAFYPEALVTEAIVERELEPVDNAPGRLAPAAAPDTPGSSLTPAAALGGLYQGMMAAVEKPLLQAALTASEGDVGRAAALPGISVRAFNRKLASYAALPAADAANDVDDREESGALLASGRPSVREREAGHP
ncbi:sigma-54 dependent transcriptional regulator [Phenylobacterium sp. LjRoot219]|uniref:sigma-54-dependent transcriptional regulator n=1 Tax=Phenylobacterium sp. LjRoot219 TaxID=3342283 RepID=UPI003ECC20C4